MGGCILSRIFNVNIFLRNLATDNVEKVPLYDRARQVSTIGEVVERKAIVVSYSNEVQWEVQINCSDPAGNLLVKYDTATVK